MMHFPNLNRFGKAIGGSLRTQGLALNLVGDRATPRRPRSSINQASPILEEAIRLVSVDPSLLWAGLDSRTSNQALDMIVTLGSLTVGPSPSVVRRCAVGALLEVMDELSVAGSDGRDDIGLPRVMGPPM